jgi:hypothetical protein
MRREKESAMANECISYDDFCDRAGPIAPASRNLEGNEPGLNVSPSRGKSKMTNTVHEAFRALGYEPHWTGGNCRAWRKQVGKLAAYICDESSGLGDSFDEEYVISVELANVDYSDSLFCMTGNFSEVTEYARLHLEK